MKSCPFCYQNDVDERASKCPHCGAWLDGGAHESSEFDELRRQLRSELREDRQDYQDYMKSIFNRVQFAASVVLALVIGTSAWFGFRTDRSISDIKNEITSRVEAEFHTQKTRDLMGNRISATVEKMEPEIARKAEEVVSLQAKKALENLSQTLEQAEGAAKETETRAKKTLAEIKSLEMEIEPAKVQLARIEETAAATSKAIVSAAKSPVKEAVLPMDAVELEEKAGLDQLKYLMAEKRPKALGFNLSMSGYYGPMIWKYFDNLTRLPDFRYVVITENGSLIGVFDASTLVSALNPPDAKKLTAEYPLSNDSLPDQEEVRKWSEFAERLNTGDDDAKRKLASYPGFVSGTESVAPLADKREVLSRMQTVRVDWLPVVDGPGGRFIGVINRSNLTAGLLLEIATRVEAPQ